jgi:hypothetical protein
MRLPNQAVQSRVLESHDQFKVSEEMDWWGYSHGKCLNLVPFGTDAIDHLIEGLDKAGLVKH